MLAAKGAANADADACGPRTVSRIMPTVSPMLTPSKGSGKAARAAMRLGITRGDFPNAPADDGEEVTSEANARQACAVTVNSLELEVKMSHSSSNAPSLKPRHRKRAERGVQDESCKGNTIK